MESSGNNPSSPSVHRYNTRFKKQHHNIVYNEDSDISDNNFIENDDNKLDIHKYRVLLNDLFPSQYSNEKVLNYNRLKKVIKSKRKNKHIKQCQNVII